MNRVDLPESMAVWIDGERGAAAPPTEGSIYGDGLFEIMAVRDGRIAHLGYHLERLIDGCKRLKMAPPSETNLTSELQGVVTDDSPCVLKLVVTRAAGRRPPRRILSRHPWPEYPRDWVERGIHLHLCKTHLGHHRDLAGVKHLNRLEQILARLEWTDSDDIQEGLMVDQDGAVIGGTMSNVFAWLPHGVLATPGVRLCGVAGVMRRHLLARAEQEQVQLRVATLWLTELMHATEIFICNSVIGVWPVAAIDHWKYAVGPVTRRAQAWAAE